MALIGKAQDKRTSETIIDLLKSAKEGDSIELIISQHQKELFSKPQIQNAILNSAKNLKVHIGTDDLGLVGLYKSQKNIILYENDKYRDIITLDFCTVGNDLLVLDDSPRPGYEENANMFLRRAKNLTVNYRKAFYDVFNKTL